MYTQVYFNVTSKVMELHFNQWLRSQGREWASEPERFLQEDDITVLQEMRTSEHPHARAIIHRERFSLAYETSEHLSQEERESFQTILPQLRERFGHENWWRRRSGADVPGLRLHRQAVAYRCFPRLRAQGTVPGRERRSGPALGL